MSRVFARSDLARPSADRKPVLPLALGGALALAILVALATWPPGSRLELFEYGHWLGPASDMLRGKTPFRDTFPIHGFLSDGGLDALLFLVSGPNFKHSVWLHQALGVLFQPAILLVAVGATRRPRLCLALTPLALALSPGLVFDRAVIPLLSLAAFLFSIDAPPRRAPALLAGVLGVLGLFSALEFGTFVLVGEIGAVAWAAIDRDRAVVAASAFSCGVAILALPALAWLAVRGALVAFFETSFIDLPMRIGAAWGLPFPGPLALLESWARGQALEVAGVAPIGVALATRLYLIPLVVLIGGSVVIARRREADRPALVRALVTIAACALCFRYVSARFHHESGNALTEPVLVLSYCVAFPRRVGSRAAAASILAALLIAGIFGGLRQGYDLVLNAARFRARLGSCPDCVPLDDLNGGGILVPAAESRALHSLRSFVDQSAAAGPMLDLSNRPALYFFLERTNPTRFYQVPMMEAFQAEVVASLEEHPPACVILASGTPLDAFDGRSNEARIPMVWDYVRVRYPRRRSFGGDVLALPP
jgi:hypothetical protein